MFVSSQKLSLPEANPENTNPNTLGLGLNLELAKKSMREILDKSDASVRYIQITGFDRRSMIGATCMRTTIFAFLNELIDGKHKKYAARATT